MPALGPTLTYGGGNKKGDSLTGRERERIKTKGSNPRRLLLAQLKKAGDFKSTCHVAPPNVDLCVALGARVTRCSLTRGERAQNGGGAQGLSLRLDLVALRRFVVCSERPEALI
ncbi:hypothetical protein MRX96_015253 [Rhipicephalus microplus]